MIDRTITMPNVLAPQQDSAAKQRHGAAIAQRVALALAHHLAPLLAMLQEQAGSHARQTEAKRVTCKA